MRQQRVRRADRRARLAVRGRSNMFIAMGVVLCVAWLSVVVVHLLFGPPDSAASWAGMLGLGIIAAALAAHGWASGRGMARPALRRSRTGVLVRGGRLAAATWSVTFVGLALLTWQAIEDPTTSSSRRAQAVDALLATLGPVVTPIALIVCAILFLRPEQVLLTPTGIRVRTTRDRRTLEWDEIATLRSLDPGATLALDLVAVDGTRTHLPTATFDLTLWEMHGVLLHYMNHAAAREGLRTSDALADIERVRQEVASPDGPDPRWIPAPRIEVTP